MAIRDASCCARRSSGDCEPIIRRLKGEAADVLPKNLGDAGKGMTKQRRLGAGQVGQHLPPRQLKLLERPKRVLYEVG
jgi:hypothetical protein